MKILLESAEKILAMNMAIAKADHQSRVDEIYRQNFAMVAAIDTSNRDMDMAHYNMDLSLFKSAPVAVVPKYSAFERLTRDGHRFLIAEDGMYLEVRRPWLYFVHQLARQVDVAMPYGRIEPLTELAFGRISAVLDPIRAFIDAARTQCPNEWMDMLVWDRINKKMSTNNVSVISNSPGSVKYEVRALTDDESIAIDMHSHGNIPAFFSDTDDRDDAGSVKISGVIGNLDSDEPTVVFRLCVLGLYLPVKIPADRLFGSV